MINEEDKFQNKLNRLIESKSFEFDAANWEKANAMMDSSRIERPSIRKYIAFSSVVLLLLSISIAFFTMHSEQPEKLSKWTNDSAIQNEKITNAIAKISPLNLANKRMTKLNTPPRKISKVQELQYEKLDLQPSNLKELEYDVQPSKVGEDRLIKDVKNEVSKKDKPSIKQIKKLAITQNLNDKNGGLELHNLAQPKKMLETQPSGFITEKNTDPFISTNPEPLSNVPANLKSVDSKIEPPSISAADNNKDSYSKDSNPSTSSQIDNNYQMWNRHEEFYRMPIKRYLDVAVDSNSIYAEPFSNTPLVVSLAPTDALPKPSPFFKHQIELEAGTTYLLGWKDNLGKDAIGFNPIGGLNYVFNFNPKFSFLTGLLYTSVGNINNADYTSQRVKYNFGEEIDYTTISAKNMYYLTIPIKFLCRFKTKNVVGLGLNASYLLDVRSQISNYNKRFNTVSQAVVTTSNGYRGGFNEYDLQFSLFYRRRLLEKLSFHAEFNFGLLDIKKDRYFKPEQFERNSGFKLTLVYDIFNK